MADMAAKIGKRTRLVAVGYASNAVGTINNVAEVVRLAKTSGSAELYRRRPLRPPRPDRRARPRLRFSGLLDLQFFGPHMGVLYSKREHLKKLRPYKVRPNSDSIPYCWEWGTLNHECIAGIKACVDYWEDVAAAQPRSHHPPRRDPRRASGDPPARAQNGGKMIAGLLAIPGLKLYGISDPQRFDNRCATFVVRIEGHTRSNWRQSGRARLFTWDGNYYALNLTSNWTSSAWEASSASVWCTTTRWRK